MNSNKNYTTTSIEELLRHKETTLQKFFDLIEKPEDIKHLESSSKVFRSLRSSIKDALNGCKDVEYHCKRDVIDDIQECISDVNSSVNDIDYSSEELERIIGQWEIAYESLERLLIEIVNHEDVDLTYYSNDISEAEIKSYNRTKIVNKLLGK